MSEAPLAQNPIGGAAQNGAGSGQVGAKKARRGAHRFDARLVVGLVLVVASIASVVGLVGIAQDGEQLVMAPRAFMTGERITVGDLEIRRVALGAEPHGYVGPDDVPAAGVVVARPVAAGELLPFSALGDARSPSATTVVVTLSTPLSATVRPGDAVDLWSSPAEEGRRFSAPMVIASRTLLVRVAANEGITTAAEGNRVELLVSRRDVARILHALANGDALAALPVSLAVGG